MLWSLWTTITATAVLLLAMFTWCNEVGAEGKTIHIGVPRHGWPPYLIVEQDHISGIAVDIIRQIGARQGNLIKFGYYPKKRAHRMVEKGEIDAWFDAKEWSASPQRYLWTDPMVDSEDRLMCRKDSPLGYNQVDDLFGKTIGTHLGYYYPRLESHFENGSIVRADTQGETAMLKMLFFGRTDAAVINKLVALWVIKNDQRLQPADFTFCEQVLDRAGYRIMFTRKPVWSAFIYSFNTELAAMKNDGRIDQIISRYR